MSDLTVYQGGLPDTIEDLAHFLLIAPEKAASMRAEIRAIQKVGLAKAVYDQKLEEQRRLCDMILDASVRLGEMTKQIAKASADRGNQYTGGKGTVLSPSQKSKIEAVQELGFSKKQVQRFETLASNKDLVEQEKVQAKAEGRMPTRTNVINLAQERKRLADAEKSKLDRDFDNLKTFRKAIAFAELYAMTDDILDSVVAVDGNLAVTIQDLNDLIGAVADIRDRLIQKGARNGKTKRA
ncbi:MAG: hypothetical protein IJ955_06845 [Oscillospiraceae bacterium]|nr:hypothetical protein [Oscillospiraceae bacterium]